MKMCKIKLKFPSKEIKILQISEFEEIELSDEQFEIEMNKVCKNFEDWKSKEIFLIRKGLHNDKILQNFSPDKISFDKEKLYLHWNRLDKPMELEFGENLLFMEI